VKYLVTGGAGFIGSHLLDALMQRGDLVTVLDDLSTGDENNIAHHATDSGFVFRRGSILDQDLVGELVAGVDVVVHLAAAVGVHLILQRPLDALLTNIKGTEVVLAACACVGRQVMIASTSEIYGKNANIPLREDSDRILGSPFKARWAYSTSKAVDEILAYTYWRESGTPSIVARLFNCVGTRQTGAYGMVVPRLVRQALRGEDLTVFGDGEQRRCFCHVLDTVSCLIRLLDDPRAVGEVYNVGSQEEISINELALLVLRLTGSSSRIVRIPYDDAYEKGFEDMSRRVPDIARVNQLTGWLPQRSLVQIVTSVIEYQLAASAAPPEARWSPREEREKTTGAARAPSTSDEASSSTAIAGTPPAG
jgi:UDP-glucose 4-epimerase